MDRARIDEAAALIWRSWEDHKLLDALPAACRPHTIDDGYAIQRRLADEAKIDAGNDGA